MTSTYGPEGVVYDKYADISEDMGADIRDNLGDSINLDKDSFFGYIRDVVAATEARANEIDQQVFDAGIVLNSSGVHLDGNVGHVGLERTGDSYSTIEEIQLTANKAVTVPAGTRIATANNVIFATDLAVVFTGAGNDTVAGTCTVPGNVEVEISELNLIKTSVNGLTAAINLTAANPGRSRQTDPQLRRTHTQVTATAGRNDVDSTYEALYEIPVTAAKIIDNDTDEHDGIVPAHTLRHVVIGGTDEEVANAIWYNKTTGVPTFGSESYTCYSEEYGQSRQINFDRGASRSINIWIYIEKLPNYPLDGDNLIKEAEAAIFDAYTLGDTVVYDQCAGAVYSVPGVIKRAVYISDAAPLIGDEVDIENDDDQLPSLDVERDENGTITAINVTIFEL